MADILLIHGSAHGAWCWRDFIPALEAFGHTAEAMDLPSHGEDSTPVNDVTLGMYADAIIARLEGKPRVLMGHSMGGYPISLVAERRPELVQHLVYLCAYVPKPGLSLAEMRKDAPRQPLIEALQMAEDRKSFTINPAMARDKFYADCSDEQVAFALKHLCAQAVAPNAVPVELTDNYTKVSRSYIRCMQDGAIPYEYQVAITSSWPDGSVVDIDSSHSPFFSEPAKLAEIVTGFLSGHI